jgi:hypothetical protein
MVAASKKNTKGLFVYEYREMKKLITLNS